jgi:hypothetical protein
LKPKDNWVKHIPFKEEIDQVFRLANDHNDFDLFVLLKNGELRVLVSVMVDINLNPG